jgi:hypothetical protein
MIEAPKNDRQSNNHKWSRISEKTGDDKTVVLTAKEHFVLWVMVSFTSQFPNFLIEYGEEDSDTVQAFVDGLAAKLV